MVPFSFELRKALFRFIRDAGRKLDSLLFANRTETRLGRRNVLRDVKLLCKRMGFNPPARTLHAFRHTFAVHYLRKGGSVFHLQKVLGHSTLEMTRRYANLMTEDLQAAHERISHYPVARRGTSMCDHRHSHLSCGGVRCPVVPKCVVQEF